MELSRSYTTAGALAAATAAEETTALQEYLESTGGIEDNSVEARAASGHYNADYSYTFDFGTPGRPNTNAARALTARTLGLDVSTEPGLTVSRG